MSRSETSWLLGSFLVPESMPESMPEPDKTFSPCGPVSSGTAQLLIDSAGLVSQAAFATL